MAGLRQDLKDFLMRGNVVDLAIAFVLGVAFAAVVTAFVEGLIMPFIAAIFGEPGFDSLIWTLNESPILYGSVITAAVNFLIIGSALFVAVKAYQRMQRPADIDLTEDAGPSDVELLTEIRDLLRAQQRIS